MNIDLEDLLPYALIIFVFALLALLLIGGSISLYYGYQLKKEALRIEAMKYEKPAKTEHQYKIKLGE